MSHRWACLLGHPVAHSLSPALHNAAFAAFGIDAHYELRDVAPADLRPAVEALRVADCLGSNVTAPHKSAVLTYLDELSDEARLLGAVNTVVNRDGRLEGANTDAPGLARWLQLSDIDVSGHRTLVLGAGGAARSSLWALAHLGAASVVVLNRTVERAESLVHDFHEKLPNVELTWGHLSDAMNEIGAPYSVVINATSLGHQGSAPRVHPSCYSRDSLALELVYSPRETGFMVAARDAGARAENGLGMLLHQAALAFERWTGHAPPMAVYEPVVRERVAA